MLSPAELANNRNNFEEFTWDLSLYERELANTKQVMLNLPLFYCTRLNIDSLTPSNQMYGVDIDEDALDTSLGLNNVCYLTWGLPDWSTYGGRIYAIYTQLLFENNVVVTPENIAIAAAWETDVAYENLPSEIQASVWNDYVSKMLTGSDWFEMMSRKIFWIQMNNQDIYPIQEGGKGMGEVKYMGAIENIWIADYYAGRDEYGSRYIPKLYSLGFGHEGIEKDRKNLSAGKPIDSDEVYETDYDAALAVWDAIRNGSV